MKKKIIIGLCALAVFVLLFPNIAWAGDGGTVLYDAILYDVYDVHSLGLGPNETMAEGIIVEILGFTVFDNVNWADPQK